MKYQWILFDADETLFHFDSFAGLKKLFSNYQIDFSKQDFAAFDAVNKPLWVAYQNNEINAQQLQEKRFQSWAERLNVPARTLNLQYMQAMADICQPLPGAVELLNQLHGHARLGIITNGFTELQSARLEKTGLKWAFEWVVISEQVGVAKPHMAVFEHAFAQMGNPPKSDILMVGDTLASDIQGGNNAGVDTCWLNHHDASVPQSPKPTYTVKNLFELSSLLKEITYTNCIK